MSLFLHNLINIFIVTSFCHLTEGKEEEEEEEISFVLLLHLFGDEMRENVRLL